MSEQVQENEKAMVNQILAALQQQGAVGSGWNKPQEIEGLTGGLVPIKVETPIGSVRIYLQFSADDVSSPDKIQSLLERLANSGLPLDAWQKKNSGWGNGGNRNNYGGNGGYNRGGSRW